MDPSARDTFSRANVPADVPPRAAARQLDDRALFDQALHRARVAAFPSGEFVGQESFMRASEILSLAVEAGIGPNASVLDLCCGVAGPGRFVTRELGCRYLGVDASPEAIAIARERAADLDCRFEVSRIPPVPPGPLDVVLLLETLLAFSDKTGLLRGITRALRPGGRFAFTLEEGLPLTQDERAAMPAADTVWLTPLPEILGGVAGVGLHVRWLEECTQPHLALANALAEAFAADASEISAQIGPRAMDELLTSHKLWSDWMRSGRVRKFAFVAEKPAAPSTRVRPPGQS